MKGKLEATSGSIAMLRMPADEKTDVAATILRILYIRDLRGLQTVIDETLVNVQVSFNLFNLYIYHHVLSSADCSNDDDSSVCCRTIQLIPRLMPHWGALAGEPQLT